MGLFILTGLFRLDPDPARKKVSYPNIKTRQIPHRDEVLVGESCTELERDNKTMLGNEGR
jgi:hypothetical protein